MKEELYVATREEWRRWLEKNHDAKKEVWLIFYRKDTSKPSIPYEGAVEEALCFGWIDSIIKKVDNERFLRKFTPRKLGSKWSASNKRRASKMVREGRMKEAGLKLVKQAKRNGEWLRTAPYQKELIIPEYIENALRSSVKALSNFNKLANSYKRMYVRWVDTAKREETRKRRLAEVIGVLERNEKLGMK